MSVWKKPTPTAEDRAEGARLAAEGYVQTSGKYRMVARLPPGKTALEALAEHDPELARHMRASAERVVQSEAARYFVRVHGEHMTLTPEVFQAFKDAGGGTA